MKDTLIYQSMLREELQRRKKLNPRYSMRAMARQLKLSPAMMSQILTGRRKLGLPMALKIAAGMQWPNDKKARFIASAKGPQIISQPDLQLAGAVDSFLNIDAEDFAKITQWYFYAILELTELRGFRSEARWIASRLSLTAKTARDAIARLIEVGLLVEDNGVLRKKSRNYSYGIVHTEQQRKKLDLSHARKIRLGIKALDQPLATREISGNTIAINSSKLPEAKKMIRKFARELMALLEDGERDKVYQLNLQLFRLDQDAGESS
jgi:uncharacterized protein (TIGR02147 family)